MSGRDSLPGHTDLICYTSLSFKSCESPVSHPYHLNPHLSSFSSNLQFSFKFWRKKHALSFHRAFFQRAKHARGRSNTSKRTLRNETLWKKALWNEWIPFTHAFTCVNWKPLSLDFEFFILNRVLADVSSHLSFLI